MKNDRGFISILAMIFALVIVGILAAGYLKTAIAPPVAPVMNKDGNNNISVSATLAPAAVINAAQSQVEAYNNTLKERMSSLMNITDLQ